MAVANGSKTPIWYTGIVLIPYELNTQQAQLTCSPSTVYFKSSLVNESGSNKLAFEMTMIFPSIPPSIKRMG